MSGEAHTNSVVDTRILSEIFKCDTANGNKPYISHILGFQTKHGTFEITTNVSFHSKW